MNNKFNLTTNQSQFDLGVFQVSKQIGLNNNQKFMKHFKETKQYIFLKSWSSF